MEINITPYGVIYKLTNVTNRKIYVGATVNLRRRMNEHKNRKSHRNKSDNYAIARAVTKHGFDNFIFEVIDEAFSKHDLHVTEKMHIELLNTTNPEVGYNSRTGHVNEKLNHRTRILMSKSHTGLVESARTKKKKSKTMIAIKDSGAIICDSSKLFADSVGTTRDIVSHAINKGRKVRGYYVFHLNPKTPITLYEKLKDTKYLELYMLVVKGVETIESIFDVQYIKYE